MCGVCGFTGQVIDRDQVLESMTEVITHRGPDSKGFYTDDYMSMGFRRLSIIDLDEGQQPIYNEDKSLVLTFNGEIYNYRELREELIEKGQQVTMDGILHDINERDRQDMTRAVAPLKQADDAVLLDTSSLTLEESIAAVLRIIREKTEEKA